MNGLNLEIRWETRLCKVEGKLGYFHTWEHYSRPVEASPLVGGAPAGIVSRVFGIVEFPDAALNEMAKHMEEHDGSTT